MMTMASRKPKKGYAPAQTGYSPDFSTMPIRKSPRFTTLRLQVYLPSSVSKIVRREVYPYPYPSQRQLRGRVIRHKLRRQRERMVRTTVRVRVPAGLPLARPSYVSVERDRLNIHSRKQTRKQNSPMSKNRRRYSHGYREKDHKRRARYGQLDSPGATRFGSVAEAARRGQSIDRIAEAALASRAIQNRRLIHAW